MTSENVAIPHGGTFKDGKRIIHFVLVIRPDKLDELQLYIQNLETLGLEFEGAKGQSVELTFLLIHIPKKVAEHFSKVYNIANEEKKIHDINRKYVLRKLFETPLSHQSDKLTGDFFNSEKIMIVNKLLAVTKFGDAPEQIGLQKMLKLGHIVTAYPLHDGPVDLEDFSSSPTHDRQMLYRHWANFAVWYKEIPLNVIKRYFGCEVAFYFCWLEFFNKMLILPAIFGVLVVIVNLTLVETQEIPQVAEVCKGDDVFMCPTCLSDTTCRYKRLSEFCEFARWNFVFDNYINVGFATLMSLWATFYINLWRRRTHVLKLKWDIRFEDRETNTRVSYGDRVKRTKFDYLTGTYEPYEHVSRAIFRIAVTSLVCLLMILVDLAVVFAIVALKVVMKSFMSSIAIFKHGKMYYVMVLGCIIQVVVIKIFTKLYVKLAHRLTDYENPKTQKDYDSSFLYKKFILAFANNYTILFYGAFFRGIFYLTPHHKMLIPIIGKDTCKPLPCMSNLSTQMFFLMIFKRFAANCLTLFVPQFKKCMKTISGEMNQRPDGNPLPEYEKAYKLLPAERYLLSAEFAEMVIQYGFVTFFVSAFPLAPLCCLLNNLMEMRLDAIKITVLYRRAIPRRVASIGAWDGILLGLTYLSTVTNGLLIAFTGDFVSRKLYAFKFSTMKGFVNTTLSAFATKDNPLYDKIKPKKDICYYRAMRLPPDDPNKYHNRPDFWLDIVWRLIFVLIFEHVILVTNALLSYLIPNIPSNVKQQLIMDKKLAKEAKMALLSADTKRPPNTSRQRKKDIAQAGPIGGFSF